MLFKDSYITDAGVELFIRAAAQSGKIVWTTAATSATDADEYDTAQMNALDTDKFGDYTSSGFITNAIIDDSKTSVSVYCEVTNKQYNGLARLFGAWAKVEGDESDVLAVVARCGTGVTPTTINPVSEGLVKAFVDFSMQLSAEQAQSVQVSEGYYATNTALESEQAARESLAARIVTTHKANDEATGEDQDIFGVKKFWNGINFKEAGFDEQTASADANEFKIINTEMNHGFEASYGQDIVISSNSSVSTNFKVQGEKLSFGYYYGNGPFFSLDYSEDSGTVFMGIAPASSTGEYPISIVKGTLSEGVYLAANYAKIKKLSVSDSISGTLKTADIIPTANNNSALGTSGLRWSSIWATYINTIGAAAIGGNLEIGGNVGSNMIPEEDGLYSLGSSTNKWKSLYADWVTADTKLSAYDLEAKNEVSFPAAACSEIVASGITRGVTVGMIVFVLVENYTGSIVAGETLDNSKCKFAMIGVSAGSIVINAMEDVTFGTWKAVTYGGKEGETQNILILAIRTA